MSEENEQEAAKPPKLFEISEPLKVKLSAPWRDIVNKDEFQGTYPAQIEFTDDLGTAKLGPIARKGEESTATSGMFGMDFRLHLVVEHPRYGMYDIEVPATDETVTVPLTPACELNGRITWAGSSPSEI